MADIFGGLWLSTLRSIGNLIPSNEKVHYRLNEVIAMLYV